MTKPKPKLQAPETSQTELLRPDWFSMTTRCTAGVIHIAPSHHIEYQRSPYRKDLEVPCLYRTWPTPSTEIQETPFTITCSNCSWSYRKCSGLPIFKKDLPFGFSGLLGNENEKDFLRRLHRTASAAIPSALFEPCKNRDRP